MTRLPMLPAALADLLRGRRTTFDPGQSLAEPLAPTTPGLPASIAPGQQSLAQMLFSQLQGGRGFAENPASQTMDWWKNQTPSELSMGTEATADRIASEVAAEPAQREMQTRHDALMDILRGNTAAMQRRTGPNVPFAPFSTNEVAGALPRPGAERVAGFDRLIASSKARDAARAAARQMSPEDLARAETLRQKYQATRPIAGPTQEQLDKRAKTAVSRARKRAKRQLKVNQFAQARKMARDIRQGRPVPMGRGGGGGVGSMVQALMMAGKPEAAAELAANMQRNMLLAGQIGQAGTESAADRLQRGEIADAEQKLRERGLTGEEQHRKYAHEEVMGGQKLQGAQFGYGQQKDRASLWQNAFNSAKERGMPNSVAEAEADRAAGRLGPTPSMPPTDRSRPSPSATAAELPPPNLADVGAQESALDNLARLFPNDSAGALQQWQRWGGNEQQLQDLIYKGDPSQWSPIGRAYSTSMPENRPWWRAVARPGALGIFLDSLARAGLTGERPAETSGRQARTKFAKAMIAR